MTDVIRPATIDEMRSGQVRRILARCIGDPTPAGMERALRDYAAYARLFVRADARAICGLIGVAERAGGSAEVLHVGVAADAERQGIGRRLMRYVCEELGAAGVVAETDRGAVGFYRALGFAIEPLGERYPGRERFRCSWSACEDTLALTSARADDALSIWSMLREIPESENRFHNGAHDLPREQWRAHLERLVQVSHGVGLKPDHVPQTTLWLWDSGRPVGTSKLRHRLNEALLRSGGHVGYCVRPSDRGRGYGKALLRLTVRWARLYGIRRLLVTCDSGNIRSRMVIERNGGVLEDEQEGNCRYWVDLS